MHGPSVGGGVALFNSWKGGLLEASQLIPWKFLQGMTGVKPLSPNHRFVIALHSPDGVFETGLRMCHSREKRSKARLRGPAGHFLQSGLTAKPAQLPISRDFQRNAAGFLCVPDCVAERVGFETIVQRSFM
jgi:hypothetical protein